MSKKSLIVLISCIIFQTVLTDVYSDIIDNARLFEVAYIKLLFTDMLGNLKSLIQPVRNLESIMHNGEYIDGSSIIGYTSIDGSDLLIKPDIQTAHIVKEDHTIQFMCDIYSDANTLYPDSPRSLLKKVMQEAEQMGYTFFVGPEIEFYLFKDKSITIRDNQAYFDTAHDDEIVQFKKELLQKLQAHTIPVEKIHHEVGPSQYEISITYDNAITTADTIIQARSIISSVARSYGMHASFMPKPLFKKAGSGMHVHVSLFDTNTNTNVFYDATDAHYLSQTARYFIAGILQHIKEMSVLLNPTINSYKRLVPGYEAPVYICWGKKNRSTLIRIPETNGAAQAARAELRCPDSMANPYLAFAAILQAGLNGIKNETALPPAMEQNLYELTPQELQERAIEVLPGNLAESLIHFANSQYMFELLGQSFMYKYYSNKSEEIYAFNTYITNWECQNYL